MNKRLVSFGRQYERLMTMVVLGIISLIVWTIIASFYPSYILPSPGEVGLRFKELLTTGNRLAEHFFITFLEAVAGFLFGAVTALPLSYLLARHPRLDRLITPLVVAIQAIPIVALAPLLVIWFGFGITSKILIAALVSFFPMLTNGVVGIRETDPRLKQLLIIMGATKREIFFKLEVPTALPVIFGGVRMGLTLSVIGAVVGEFSGAGKGLGYLVYFARGTFDTPLIFVALIALAAIGVGFYLLISVLEAAVMPWKEREK